MYYEKHNQKIYRIHHSSRNHAYIGYAYECGGSKQESSETEQNENDFDYHKKKTKPAVQLKIKNAAGRKVKWASSNKKVVTVNKNGKVVAKKKGSAVITVKVKGSKTLRCKVTVKDNRKPVTKKPAPAPSPNPAPKPDGECEHNWVQKERVIGEKITCSCGFVFYNLDKWEAHCDELMEQGLDVCSMSPTDITETYYECSKCHKTK